MASAAPYPPPYIFQELIPEVPLKTCIPLIPASPLPVPSHRSFSGIIPLLTLHACQFLDFFSLNTDTKKDLLNLPLLTVPTYCFSRTP